LFKRRNNRQHFYKSGIQASTHYALNLSLFFDVPHQALPLSKASDFSTYSPLIQTTLSGKDF
jgi:hypothetical protein